MAPQAEHMTNISSGGSSAGGFMSVWRENLVLVSACEVGRSCEVVLVWKLKSLPIPDDLTPDAWRVVPFGIRALTSPVLEKHKTGTTDRPHCVLALCPKPCCCLAHRSSTFFSRIHG